MPLLTKEQILNATDLPVEDVPVPEWGGAVRARTLTGAERDAFEVASSQAREKFGFEAAARNYRARWAAACLVGEDGRPLFAAADVEALGGKSSAALDRVLRAANRLNGLGDPEDAAKNS
jgi:hypothetical protein